MSESHKKRYIKMTKEEKLKLTEKCRRASQVPEVEQKISETMKKQWSKRTKEEKTKILKPWLEAGHKAASRAMKKRWASMTKEEKLENLKVWLKAGQRASKEKLFDMTKEEKRIYLKSFSEAGHKAIRNKFAKMTKEEKLRYVKPWMKASQTLEARQRRSKNIKANWDKMTKEERSKRILSIMKATQKANPSSIEKAIWKVLDEFGIEYKTQVSFNNSKFIVDIYVPAQRLIIECNGDYWHNYEIFPNSKIRDNALEKYANKNDYKMVWLWESKIRKNPKSAFIEGLKAKGGVKF